VFLDKNQYRTDRAVKAILNHSTIYNTLTQPKPLLNWWDKLMMKPLHLQAWDH